MDSDCSWRQRYLETALAGRAESAAALAKALAGDEPVVLVGENHFHESGKRYYPELLALLKASRPDIDCVLVETEERGQHHIDRYMARQVSHAYLRETVWRSEWIAFPDEPLMTASRDMGLRMIAIDKDRDRALPNRVRDSHMADRIARALASGACRSAVVPVGAEHASGSERPADADSSIPAHLRPMGIRSASVLIAFPNKGRAGSWWFEERCAWNPPLIPAGEAPFAFLTTPSGPPLMPGKGTGGAWSAYRAVIVVP